MASAPVSALNVPLFGKKVSRALAVSLGVHLVALVGYSVWDSRQVDVLEMPSEPIKATLVKLGKKRDPKLLPRLKPAPAPPPPSRDKAVPVPAKDKPQDAAPVEDPVDPERKQSALDRIREQVDRDDARKAALARAADRARQDVQEEPDDEGEEDGHPEGDSLTRSNVNAYLGTMVAAVKRHYLVPSVITTAQCDRLVAVVLVRLSTDGAVTRAEIHKSSGNDLFDSAVIRAVKTASPLPPPPPDMRDMVTRGFGFNFRCAI